MIVNKLVKKNRFAVCQKSRAHGKVVISGKEEFQFRLIKCLPCVLCVAHSEHISSPCAEIQNTRQRISPCVVLLCRVSWI